MRRENEIVRDEVSYQGGIIHTDVSMIYGGEYYAVSDIQGVGLSDIVVS